MKRLLRGSLLLVLATLVIVGCTQIYSYARLDRVPKVNARPQHHLEVSGHVDAGLVFGLQVEYNSTNPACEVSLGMLVGRFPRRAQYAYAVEPRDGVYAVAVPLDGVEAGACGWRLTSIYFSAEKDGVRFQQALLSLEDGARSTREPIDLTCRFPGAPDGRPWVGTDYGCRYAPAPMDFLAPPDITRLEVNVRDAG
jgi:hypothetical protein